MPEDALLAFDCIRSHGPGYFNDVLVSVHPPITVSHVGRPWSSQWSSHIHVLYGHQSAQVTFLSSSCVARPSVWTES